MTQAVASLDKAKRMGKPEDVVLDTSRMKAVAAADSKPATITNVSEVAS